MARFTHPAIGPFDGGQIETSIQSYTPVWSGTGLTYTGQPAEGFYIKLGNLVTVQIDVEFDNVTNFGSGQYFVTLPIVSKYHTDVYGGSIHKTTNQGIDHYSIKGHLTNGTNSVSIWAVASNALDEPFDHQAPVNLTTDDKFHMSFSYIAE